MQLYLADSRVELGRAVFRHDLVEKTVRATYTAVLVIAAIQVDMLGKADFESKQKSENLRSAVTSIYEVSVEYVRVVFSGPSAQLEDLEQIVITAVKVANYCDFGSSRNQRDVGTLG